MNNLNANNLAAWITIVIACAAFLSPVIVALINNRHSRKMRALELEHEQTMKNLEFKQQSTVKQFEVYYHDKQKAFDDFSKAAGMFMRETVLPKPFGELNSAINSAILLCSFENQTKLSDFSRYVNEIYYQGSSSFNSMEYAERISSICIALNEELLCTQPEQFDRKF